MLLPFLGSGTSFAVVNVPPGFTAEIFATDLGHPEDFAFDADGVLWVGLGDSGDMTKIEFDETTPLPVDGNTLPPAITGFDAVYGVAFDAAGNLFVPEFCSGASVKRIDAGLLSGPLPIDASVISDLTSGLACPDGIAEGPAGSVFEGKILAGDVAAHGVFVLDPTTGAVDDFIAFGADIEEITFSNDGQMAWAVSPSGQIFKMDPITPTVLASGLPFPDAAAQGPGNEFGTDLFIGDLTNDTILTIDPMTGNPEAWVAHLGPDFVGTEDIIFDQAGRMYVLGFGHNGSIVRISPDSSLRGADIDIKPGSDPNSIRTSNKGVVPVAILTTESFDATQVDVNTVRFGPGGASEIHENAHLSDVDNDGDIDMVLHFWTQDIGIAAGDTEATLTGETIGGDAFEGTDTLRTI